MNAIDAKNATNHLSITRRNRMSQHPSLRSSEKDKAHRSVLKRYERLKLLKDKEKWDEKQSVFGLQKVKVIRFKIKKEKAAPAEGAEAAAAAPGAEGAALPATGTAGTKGAPAAKGAAPAPSTGTPAKDAAKPKAGESKK
jgi:small basic protein (TIGR04137 family)